MSKSDINKIEAGKVNTSYLKMTMNNIKKPIYHFIYNNNIFVFKR